MLFAASLLTCCNGKINNAAAGTQHRRQNCINLTKIEAVEAPARTVYLSGYKLEEVLSTEPAVSEAAQSGPGNSINGNDVIFIDD